MFSQIDKLYGDIESTEEAGGEESGSELPGDISAPPPPMGGDMPTPPSADDGMGLDTSADASAPPPLAERNKFKKDMPLILENKGILLPNIEGMTKKTKTTIDELNKEIDNLVKE